MQTFASPPAQPPSDNSSTKITEHNSIPHRAYHISMPEPPPSPQQRKSSITPKPAETLSQRCNRDIYFHGFLVSDNIPAILLYSQSLLTRANIDLEFCKLEYCVSLPRQYLKTLLQLICSMLALQSRIFLV